MQRKKGILITIVVIQFLALMVSAYIIVKQDRLIDSLKRSRVNLAVNERIEYFDLVGMNNQQVNADMLNRSHASLIFVFKYPCAPCNHNLTLWRRMAKILKDDIDVYGIWLGNEQELFDFAGEANLGFDIYMPTDVERFKKELSLNLNYARTILYANNKVVQAKMADLEGDDYTWMIRTAKQISKNKANNSH
jgi:hypothetical protein